MNIMRTHPSFSGVFVDNYFSDVKSYYNNHNNAGRHIHENIILRVTNDKDGKDAEKYQKFLDRESKVRITTIDSDLNKPERRILMETVIVKGQNEYLTKRIYPETKNQGEEGFKELSIQDIQNIKNMISSIKPHGHEFIKSKKEMFLNFISRFSSG